MAGLTNGQEQVIVRVLKDRLKASTIILFGSAAQNRLRPDSDIDIAIMTPEVHNPYDLFIVAGELAEKLKREVDLVDFRQASPVFQVQIASSGIVLLDQDPADRHYAYMRAYKEYAMLNEERKEILQNYDVSLGGLKGFGKRYLSE